MESATDPGEFERAQRAFMARIARMVLPDGQGIDRRDAMVLIDCDVIRPDETEESEDSIDRLRKGPTEATSTGLGPLYFYPGESGGQAVVRARDLLLDRRREVRQIAIAHLEKTAESADSMSRPTRKALERLTPVLTSEGWRGAAIELVDALDNDWLLNLAGMNQCRVPALQELWSEYVNAALRPPIASVQGCSPAILCPSLHQEAMNSCAARLRQGTQSLVALCSEYIETVGHVPVGGDCSLGRTLMARAGEESLSERLRTVLEWAAKSGSPFARYHACEAALSSAAQLSQEQREQVATWFWEAALPAAGTAKPTKSQAAWALAGQLARYYVQYLEVRLPSDHGEAVAAMAWWMTVRLMAVTRGGVGPTRDFGGQLDRVYGAFAAEIWDVVGPPMAPSILRWLTAFGPSPWILSLMSAVESADDVKWLMAGPGPGTQEDRANVLIALAMQIANVPFEEGQYRFTQTARRVLGWAAADELDESKRAVLTAWAEGIDWSPPESLANALEALDQQESPIQRWMCHAIRQRVAAGALSGDDLWKIVSADDWKNSKWRAIDTISIQALGCALVDDAARRGPEWWPQLPHLLSEIAEQRGGTESDRPAMFGMVLRACCALNAPSALSRLLRGRAGHRYRPLATAVRGNLEQVLPQAGGWAAGRLRALMVDLL